jgi:hypothetical protein
MPANIKYRIIGRRGIGVYKTGQVVDGDDLVGVNIQALLDGGHIAVETTKIKIESVKEEE